MAEIYSIISGKGGVGKTFFSINFASALAKLDKRVLLVDANITSPNISIILKIKKNKTLHDFLRFEANIEDIIYSTPFGFDLIPGSLKIEDLIGINLDRLAMLSKIRKDYDYILLDSSAGLGKETYASIKASDESIIITVPEKPSLMDAIRAIKVCKTLKIPIKGVVLNRLYRKVDLSKIEVLLGERILGIIEEDESVEDSLNLGIPLLDLYPDSPAAVDILNIARNIIGVKETKKEEKPKSLINRIISIFRWR